MAVFQLEERNALREKYRDNPAGLAYVEKRLGPLALASIGDMANHGIKEHQAYKEHIYQGELGLARAVITNQNTPETARWATLKDLCHKTAAFFPGSDRAAALDRVEEFAKSAWKELWLNRLTSLRESDPEAALKLTRDALDHEEERKQQNLTQTALENTGSPADAANPDAAGTREADAALSSKAPANADNAETAVGGESSGVVAPAAKSLANTPPDGESPAIAESPAKPARSRSDLTLHVYLTPEQLAVEHRKNEQAVYQSQ